MKSSPQTLLANYVRLSAYHRTIQQFHPCNQPMHSGSRYSSRTFPPKAQLVAGHRWGPPLCVGPVRRSGRLDLWPVRRTASGPTIPSAHGIREGDTMYSTHFCVFLVAFRITYFLTSVIHLYWEPVHQFSLFSLFLGFFLNLTFTIIDCYHVVEQSTRLRPVFFFWVSPPRTCNLILCNTLTCQKVQFGAICNVSVCKQPLPKQVCRCTIE